MTEESTMYDAHETTPLTSSRNTKLYASVEEKNPGTPDTAESTIVNGNDSLAPDDTPNASDKSTEFILPVNDVKTKPTKKKKGKKITIRNAIIMEKEVQMNMIMHNLASHHFSFREFWFFTVSQAVLTMFASILAFVASTTLLSERKQTIFTVIAGSTSSLVVFLQTLGGSRGYGTRAAMHEAAAIDLRELRDSIVLLKHKLEHEAGFESFEAFEAYRTRHISNCDDTTGPFGKLFSEKDDDEEEGDEDHTMTFEEIRSRVRQSLSGCKSNVPMNLSEAFHAMKSNMMVGTSMKTNKYYTDVYGSVAGGYFNSEFKAYDVLAGEILISPFFPWLLPDAKDVVEKAMRRWRSEQLTYASFLVNGGDVSEE